MNYKFMGLLDFLFGKKFFRTTVSSLTEDKIKNDWVKIEQLIKLSGPSNLKQALLLADRSLDSALRDIFAGETMGERLKMASTRFDRYLYDDIWKAHKIRNTMVHEANFDPPYYVINKSVEDLKRALTALGVKI